MASKPSRSMPGADLDPADLDLGFLGDSIAFHLRIVQAASLRSFGARTGVNRMAPGWYALLMLIGRNPGITPTVLSQAGGRDKSTLTPALRDMQRLGYLTMRQLETDRRRYTLQLTPAGEKELIRLTKFAEQHEQQIDSILGDDKAQLLRVMERLRRAFDVPPSDIAATRPKRTRRPPPKG